MVLILLADASTDIERLKSEIANISQWSRDNSMVLNVEKSMGMVRYRGAFGDEHAVENEFNNIKFCSSLRFLGVHLETSLGWGCHIDFVVKKCCQRLYILRRMRSVTTDQQFIQIYVSLIRSLLEYASPAFIGLSKSDENRIQQVQKRCLKIKGQLDLATLTSRRTAMARRLFSSMAHSDTAVKELLPMTLPSGRVSVPFCRSSFRRSSFVPKMCILSSSSFYD